MSTKSCNTVITVFQSVDSQTVSLLSLSATSQVPVVETRRVTDVSSAQSLHIHRFLSKGKSVFRILMHKVSP